MLPVQVDQLVHGHMPLKWGTEVEPALEKHRVRLGDQPPPWQLAFWEGEKADGHGTPPSSILLISWDLQTKVDIF